MKIIINFFLILLILMFSKNFINAYTNEDQLIEDQIYNELSQEKIDSNTPRPSFGGWFIPRILKEKKDSALTSDASTLKLWIKIYFSENSYFYIRGRYTFSHIISEGEDYESYELEKTDHNLDFDNAFINLKLFSNNVNFYGGRKLYKIGTGIAFSGRADGGQLNIYTPWGDLEIFSAYTGLLKKENNPYALSVADFDDGAKRLFSGATLTEFFLNQNIYIFALLQKDMADEEEDSYTRYQSQYFGAGLRGILFETLDYYGEYIYQKGESYIFETTIDDTRKIKAYAFTSQIRYFFIVPVNPVIILNYAIGSGDKDRTGSATSATGNTSKEDNGFIGFGSYNGGDALRPALSNIQVIRAGFSFSPFSWADSLLIKRMSIIARYSNYRKRIKEAAINSENTTLPEKDLGTGFDVNMRWKIFSDFSIFAGYGLFIPGKAYDTEEPKRHFMSGGLYISF